MKKFLLLATAFTGLFALPEKGFAKCDVYFTLTRSSGSYSTPAFAASNGKVYFFPGESITAGISFSGYNCSCGPLVWYKDGDTVQLGGASYKVTSPGSYKLVGSNCSWSFIAAYPLTEPNWTYSIKSIDGTYNGHSGIADNYSAWCGIHLTSSAESSTGNPMTGFPVDWYLDSVYQFTKGGTVQFTHPGYIYYRVNPAYSFYCINPLQLTLTLSPYDLLINVQLALCFGTRHDTILYEAAGDYCLLTAYERNSCETRSTSARWLLDNSYYASTLPGEALTVYHSGFLTAVDTIHNITSRYKILLHGAKLHSIDSPEMLNLRYKIINIFGQVMETGNAHDYNILRNDHSIHTLRSGLFLVIYFDALDNRQVLTDKVFVTNQ